ncbi:putative nuclease HARBI1 [Collichthys lucidus]|uniref:ribonuclease H n=1 Tax=Collichthys lucidus TaxID=240159 RepID=A0A4U5TWM0_COLLU|nr:putative nuclease HARBI1 [Collichthys lucidus]
MITAKSDFRPCKQQYPLKQEAIDGITPVFNHLLQAGVIVPCPDSPVRTPLFPVKKIRDEGQPVEWRFVQDLQAVNAAVQPRAPNVPNPYTILSQVPADAKFFSVVDLSNAFFSVPVHPDSQFWFAFTFNGKPYTFTRLCQGYCESPTIYNAALKDSLEPLVLTPGTALLQYVDDLIICSPTKEQYDGEAHDCVASLQQVCTPRPDLRETPLINPDLVFYVDGSAFRDTQSGLNKVGFAVCDDHSIVQSGSLPSNYSAQAAELIALTAACTLAKGRSVTIYTDSRYAFGVVHDFGALWKHRNFLKSDGKPILHHDKVLALLDAILLPKQIAVCKCQAHTGDTDSVSKGNARADAAAKRAADLSLPPPPAEAFCFLSHILPDSHSALQSFASPPEVTQWRACGAQYKDKVWFGPDGRPCLPKHFFPHFAKLTHGLDHVSKGGMLQAITQHWFTKGFAAYAQKYCQSCVICATYNAGRGIPVPAAAHPPPDKPFDHLMMDFIELTPDKGKKYCLVMVDMWSKWVEAFPAKHANSHAVTKALLTEIIPRWGIPSRISSDNGTHFVNAAVEAVGQFLGIDMRKHCVYHPQSGGAVERENGTLKAKLAKCCEETGLSWMDALPIVLSYMRMRQRSRVKLSPFEILFGRPPNVGMDPYRDRLPPTSLCDDNMIEYCKLLSGMLSQDSQQANVMTTTLRKPKHVTERAQAQPEAAICRTELIRELPKRKPIAKCPIKEENTLDGCNTTSCSAYQEMANVMTATLRKPKHVTERAQAQPEAAICRTELIRELPKRKPIAKCPIKEENTLDGCNTTSCSAYQEMANVMTATLRKPKHVTERAQAQPEAAICRTELIRELPKRKPIAKCPIKEENTLDGCNTTSCSAYQEMSHILNLISSFLRCQNVLYFQKATFGINFLNMACPFDHDPVDEGAAILRRELQICRQRVLRPRIDISAFPDNFLFERYRFTSQSIIYIHNLIRPHISNITSRSHALTSQQILCVALRFFANGSFLYNIGDAEHLSKATVCRAIRRVCLALKRLLHIFVVFPGHKPVRAIKEEFHRIAGFPNVIGCIDGTHIPITAPSHNEADYVNRKSIHSINVQIICDAAHIITNVEAKWPGSVHDSRIYRESNLSARLQHGEFDGLLLGDRGYTCQPRLLTPYPDPEPGPQQNFNRAHSRTRARVEMTIGLLKARFQCLRHLRVTPERACDIIVACVVLHNIATIRGEQHPALQIDDPDEDPVHLPAMQDGRAVRDTICTNHF